MENVTSEKSITLNQNLIDIATQNPGLVVTPDQFTDIVVVPPNVILVGGCIKQLRYGSGDKDLTYMILENPASSYGLAQIANLNDFRKTLQAAANHGHRVTFCLNVRTKRMFMLNVLPCLCRCEKRDRPNPPVLIPPVVTAPTS